MPDLFENPLGLDGFEFVEFCAPQKGLLEPVFESMGFTLVARHRSKDVQLWRQGEINLIANYEPRSPAAYFAAEHGASACGMAFRVRDAAAAYKEAIARADGNLSAAARSLGLTRAQLAYRIAKDSQ